MADNRAHSVSAPRLLHLAGRVMGARADGAEAGGLGFRDLYSEALTKLFELKREDKPLLQTPEPAGPG